MPAPAKGILPGPPEEGSKPGDFPHPAIETIRAHDRVRRKHVLQMLTLVLRNAGILEAIEEGMLPKTAVKKRRAAPMNAADKDKVVARSDCSIHPNIVTVASMNSIPNDEAGSNA